MMRAQGLFSQMKGFDMGVRMFAENEQQKASFWKKHKGKILAAAALAGFGGLAYANRDAIMDKVNEYRGKSKGTNEPSPTKPTSGGGSAGSAGINEAANGSTHDGESTSATPEYRQDGQSAGPQVQDSVERQKNEIERQRAELESAIHEKHNMVWQLEDHVNKEGFDNDHADIWAHNVLTLITTTVESIEANPEGLTETQRAHLLSIATKAKKSLKWADAKTKREYEPRFDAIATRIGEMAAIDY